MPTVAHSLIRRQALAAHAGRTLAGNVVLLALAIALGAGPVAIGLLGVVPVLALLAPLQLPRLIRRFGLRGASRRLGAVAVAAPLLILTSLALPSSLALPALLVAVALAFALNTVHETLSSAIIRQLGQEQGSTLLGSRQRWVSVASLVTNVAAGVTIDALEATGWTAIAARALPIALSVALAATGALAQIRLAALVPDDTPEDITASTSRLSTTGPRPPFGIAIVWGLVFGLTLRHGDATVLTVLGRSVGELSLLAALVAIAGALSAPRWGRLGDRLGAPRVLRLVIAGLVLQPAWYLVALSGHSWALLPAHLWYGLVMTGWIVLQPAWLIGHDGDPTAYTRFQAAFGLASAGGPLLGSAILVAAEPLGAVRAHEILFLLATVLRLGVTAWIVRQLPGRSLTRLAHRLWRRRRLAPTT